jgi:hypothetical protein
MKKFMVLYMTPAAAVEQMIASPEEIKKVKMEPWLAWFKKGGKAFVDMGTPLGNGMHLTKKGSTKGKTKVTGYSILQAKDLNAVKAMLADSPQLMIPKASFEVFEMMPMM